MAYAHIRTCRSCAARNRVIARHLAADARCAKCKTPIGPVSEPIDVDTAAFDEIVAAVPVPVLVDFWAAWCGPCRVAAPEVHRLAGEMAGRAVVLKVDTDAHPELGARYRVQAIPNFLVLKDGRVVGQYPGVVPRSQMRQWLERAMAGA
jgi:thioredoxin 2